MEEKPNGGKAEITNAQEFLEAVRAAEERLGIEDSGIMELRGKMDSSDTIRYDVVFVPRKPQSN